MDRDDLRKERTLFRKRALYRRNKRLRLRRGQIALDSESEQNPDTSDSDNDSVSSDSTLNDNNFTGELNAEERGEERQNQSGDERIAEGTAEEVAREEHPGDREEGPNQIEGNHIVHSDHDRGETESSDAQDEENNAQSEEMSDDDGNHDNSESEAESQQSEGQSDEEDQADGDELIYPGAPITLHQSLVAIFTLMSAENLSGKLMTSILQLIALHCPANSIVKKTLHTFRTYFSKFGDSLIIFHYFCSKCIYPLETQTSVCPKCKEIDVSYFLELPLLQQLQNFFNRAHFFQDLQFRFREDRKFDVDNIEDIYDGSIYKDEMRNGFLSNGSNISFMWYTDGVSIFKSSKFSIWPLCLVINELPYKMRTLPENILLVGLWFGKCKPNPNVFLRPLHRTMHEFEKNGHSFKLPDNTQVNVKGKVICGTCDLPAKCKFLQFKQFNSYFGCTKCLIEGGRAPTGKGTVQVYPYSANIQKRTHDQTIEFGEQALEARRTNRDASICGVKGPTLLSKIVPDLIKCTAIDIMHGVFLGICKTLINLWFSSTFSSMPWSVHHLFDVADEKIRNIKSPSLAQRAPRSLTDIKFWKASEYKVFMLYYSVPVLKNVLDEVYFKHHCLLVSGISLLSQDSISLSQVQAASALLASYVSDFARLYPLRYLGLNFHQLVHLSDCVLELGPLWVYSCFFLENFNGKINKFFHGTQHVALQICSSVAMFMKMPLLRSNLPPDSAVSKFCLAVENKSKAVKIADQIDHCTFAVGTYSNNQMRQSLDILRQSLDIRNGRCTVFYRLQKKGIIYFSEEYERKSKGRESTYILFGEGNLNRLARVLRFVRWSNCGNLCYVGCRNCPASYFAIVRSLNRQFWFIHDMRNIRLPYMSKVESTENIIAIEVQSILGLCFCIEANDEKYIAVPVNRLEVE